MGANTASLVTVRKPVRAYGPKGTFSGLLKGQYIVCLHTASQQPAAL